MEKVGVGGGVGVGSTSTIGRWSCNSIQVSATPTIFPPFTRSKRRSRTRRTNDCCRITVVRYAHTRTHTRTHARTRAYAHTQVHAHAHARTYRLSPLYPDILPKRARPLALVFSRFPRKLDADFSRCKITSHEQETKRQLRTKPHFDSPPSAGAQCYTTRQLNATSTSPYEPQAARKEGQKDCRRSHFQCVRGRDVGEGCLLGGRGTPELPQLLPASVLGPIAVDESPLIRIRRPVRADGKLPCAWDPAGSFRLQLDAAQLCKETPEGAHPLSEFSSLRKCLPNRSRHPGFGSILARPKHASSERRLSCRGAFRSRQNSTPLDTIRIFSASGSSYGNRRSRHIWSARRAYSASVRTLNLCRGAQT